MYFYLPSKVRITLPVHQGCTRWRGKPGKWQPGSTTPLWSEQQTEDVRSRSITTERTLDAKLNLCMNLTYFLAVKGRRHHSKQTSCIKQAVHKLESGVPIRKGFYVFSCWELGLDKLCYTEYIGSNQLERESLRDMVTQILWQCPMMLEDYAQILNERRRTLHHSRAAPGCCTFLVHSYEYNI